MSTSSAPLSPSKRTNEDADDKNLKSKRAKKGKERAEEEAPSAKPSAPAGDASSAAKPSTQELYNQADPARAIRPLSEVNPKWQYQLHVRCEWAKVGFLSSEGEQRTESYNKESFAYRDLIMSGNASAFDLTKTLLCAFGLSDSPFNHANDNSMLLLDVQLTVDEKTGKAKHMLANDMIRGLHVPNLPDKRVSHSVTAAQLKSVKLCQLLDKPLHSTTARSRDTGVRSAIFLNVMKPERVATVSRAGGAVETAAQAMFGFAVTLEAIGAQEHMASGLQARFPRCVGGAGKVHGGNEFDEDEDEEVDELNCTTFNNGRRVQGLIGGSGDPVDDVWCIRNWLRMPLFEVDDQGVARCLARRLR